MSGDPKRADSVTEPDWYDEVPANETAVDVFVKKTSYEMDNDEKDIKAIDYVSIGFGVGSAIILILLYCVLKVNIKTRQERRVKRAIELVNVNRSRSQHRCIPMDCQDDDRHSSLTIPMRNRTRIPIIEPALPVIEYVEIAPIAESSQFRQPSPPPPSLRPTIDLHDAIKVFKLKFKD